MSVEFRPTLVSPAFVLCMAAGCATTNVSDRQQTVDGSLPRPNQIWVYPFAATPADVPPNSALAGNSQYYSPQTPQEIA